ncbi:alkylmercury lyase family protein [Rhodococcus ruber]|uniref:organomercurial lyase n=1 Tax=Rhodococcus TaxID=1827 RepID=UPI0009352CFB|nr:MULTISPECIES: organomercurial lyase [Rhodococcus]OLL16135.1 hypothetical protein BKE56_028635 [Rhodococcus sp. M8]
MGGRYRGVRADIETPRAEPASATDPCHRVHHRDRARRGRRRVPGHRGGVRRRRGRPRPSAPSCCTHRNFFADRATARGWADGHPQVGGIVVDLADATRLGVTIFGGRSPVDLG